MKYNKIIRFFNEKLTLQPNIELAFIWAVEMNHKILVKSFAYNGVNIRCYDNHAIKSAIEKNNVEMVNLLTILGHYTNEELDNLFNNGQKCNKDNESWLKNSCMCIIC